MLLLLYYILLLLVNFCTALGINCRGSGVCPLATFEKTQDVGIMQALRDQIYNSNLPGSTVYSDGEHITCVGNKIQISIGPSLVGLGGSFPAGAICVFPQNIGDSGLSLDQIKTLADDLLDHGCTTCGSVPITYLQGSNGDVDDGELTFNFVSEEHSDCTGNCIASGQNDGSDGGGGGDAVVTVTQSASQQPATTTQIVTQTVTQSVSESTSQTSSEADSQSATQVSVQTVIETTTAPAPSAAATTGAPAGGARSNSPEVSLIVLSSLLCAFMF